MLKFAPRGRSPSEPIGDLPDWLSAMLRNRGIDTPEKAEAFLHPSLNQLHDPMLMQDMDKACGIIRTAIDLGEKIVVYGDYDVDGICSTSIMVETLREMGADVSWRIPQRHGEGYGLNLTAVQEMALRFHLLITVDCGITNHSEVSEAKALGMKVIVTDHHEPDGQTSPADAALNPLLGSYPFRRLCGAGVALKLTQALLGMEAVCRRLDLAALATVADIVPLISENRVIVAEGLKLITASTRPGIMALKATSRLTAPITADNIAFQLAPRLNAAGRMESALQGVDLMLSSNMDEAAAIAQHLDELNTHRRGVEQAITREAEAQMLSETDFYDNRIIIVQGEGWESGVVGLAAGKLCEKYHFPVIVLSVQGDTATGSCRSIPGVHIQEMLMRCHDLFIKFGGHEQAAGLTMETRLIPELRRRMNLLIKEHCDEASYCPVEEYDAVCRLQDVSEGMIEQLNSLQPTGAGNPAPVFLFSGVTIQQANRCGANMATLRATFAQDGCILGGFGFQMGDAVNYGLATVDLLAIPQINEFRGIRKNELQLRSIRRSQGGSLVVQSARVFQSFLQEMTQLSENNSQNQDAQPVLITEAAALALLKRGRGTLAIAHEPERARKWLIETGADAAFGYPEDVRSFATVLISPELDHLKDSWRDIILADGDLLPDEAAMIKARCPRAVLHACKPNPIVRSWIDSLHGMPREELLPFYIRMQKAVKESHGVPSMLRSLESLCEAAELEPFPVLAALHAFRELELAQWQYEPWQLSLIPNKTSLEKSALIRYIRSISSPST